MTEINPDLITRDVEMELGEIRGLASALVEKQDNLAQDPLGFLNVMSDVLSSELEDIRRKRDAAGPTVHSKEERKAEVALELVTNALNQRPSGEQHGEA